MKKTVLLLSAVMCFSLVSCGKSENSNNLPSVKSSSSDSESDSISVKEVYDSSKCKVTFSGIEKGPISVTLLWEVENKTDEEFYISDKKCIVNGFDLTGFDETKVAGKSKKIFKERITSSKFKESAITEINAINLDFSVSDKLFLGNWEEKIENVELNFDTPYTLGFK